MRNWIVLLLLCGLGGQLNSQTLYSFEFIAEISADSLTGLFGVPVEQDVELYRVLYGTTGSDQMPDTASGLFARPVGDAKGIVAYQHGTTGSRDAVPSNLNLADAFIIIAYAGQGYMCSGADYLGLGTSRGFHPYVHAETQASAGLDMLLATRQGISDLGVAWPEHIFVSGYSQGGHAAMALAQTIQERPTDDLWLNGSTPMSGPYALSQDTRELILSDEEYDFVGYIVYLLRGYQEVYGDMYSSLEDIVRPDYLPDVVQFAQSEISLGQLNNLLIPKLIANEGGIFPKKLFQESYLDLFRDTTSVQFARLRENDVFRWVPESPMRLYYCEADEQVPFENAIAASAWMNAEGAVDVKAISVNPVADHGTCAIFAVLSSIAFFDSLSVLSSNDDIMLSLAQPMAYPNPASVEVWLGDHLPSGEVSLYSLTGDIVRRFGTSRRLPLSDLPAGTYLLRLVSPSHHLSQLLIKQ